MNSWKHNNVNIVWEGASYTYLEVLYELLFRHLLDKPLLASVFKINNLKLPDVCLFLVKELQAKKIYTSKHIDISDNAPDHEDIYQVPGFQYPILVRVTSDSIKNVAVLQCVSYKIPDLETLFQKIQVFFAKRDYTKEVTFGILYEEQNYLSVKELSLDENLYQLDLRKNYGNGFLAHHDKIYHKLNNQHHGLFIFHGLAGTGKTTYIKYLAQHFGGKKKFIFVPTTYLHTLTSPSIIPILLENKNSVLVLEDAEKAVVNREDQDGNESLVSSLLNIGDGILGSMLNLSIILTFNTKKDRIDPALLRKGRLSYEYEFTPLNVTDANILLKSLKKNTVANSPMTLAEIYHCEDENGHQEKKVSSIGFKP